MIIIKKLIYIFIVTLVVTFGFTTVYATNIKGDVNNDSKVDSKDRNLIEKYIKNTLTDKEKDTFNFNNADVDDDGKITKEDINVSKVSNNTYIDCGRIQRVPIKVIELSNKAINIIQVIVPVILIITKGIDLLKAISSQKEDDIKKAQSLFVKRLILAVLIYFVFVIVKLIVSIIGNDDGIWKCTECLVNGIKYCK